MSDLPTLKGTRNTIFSPVSESGHTHCDAPDGRTNARYGQVLARVNLSARQVKAAGLMISGTYGPRGIISYHSVSLISCLANRLLAKTALAGSTLYKLTWKLRVTPAGRSISALRASVRRTSDKDSGLSLNGWVTPNTRDYKDTGINTDYRKLARKSKLTGAAWLVGWPTPKNLDAHNSRTAEGALKETSRRGSGNELTVTTQITGWPTPNTLTGGQTSRGGKRKNELLMSGAAKMAGWPTPQRHDTNKRGNTNADHHSFPHDLPNMAEWCDQPTRLTVSGKMLTGFSAGMESGGAVEPGTFPLANGAAARVGRLRGYGNAINAEAAKIFIESYLESDRMLY